jgi:CheY-like chemotaxis protein
MGLQALLVCSNEHILRVLTTILRDMGVGVEPCRDVHNALSRLERQAFDAVLIDWDQPQVAEAVPGKFRQRADHRKRLLVALMEGTASAQRAFSLGVNFVLYKPISAEKARNSLRAALRLSQDERRQGSRVAVQIPTAVSFAGVEDVSVTLLNLSGSGTTLQTTQRIPDGAQLYFHFKMPGSKDTIRLAGQLVWQDAAGRAGIRFVNVPHLSRRTLDTWSAARATDLLVPERSMTIPAAPTPAPAALEALREVLIPVSDSDRRDESRLECRLGAQVYKPGPKVPHWCSLTDLSSTGCYIEMPSPFPYGTELVIEVRAEEMRLRSRGVVRTVNPGFGMGVRFALDNEEQRQQVEGLLQFLNGGSPETGSGGQPKKIDRRHRRAADASGQTSD